MTKKLNLKDVERRWHLAKEDIVPNLTGGRDPTGILYLRDVPALIDKVRELADLLETLPGELSLTSERLDWEDKYKAALEGLEL